MIREGKINKVLRPQTGLRLGPGYVAIMKILKDVNRKKKTNMNTAAIISIVWLSQVCSKKYTNTMCFSIFIKL